MFNWSFWGSGKRNKGVTFSNTTETISEGKIPIRRLLDPKSPRLTAEERTRISQSLGLFSIMKDQAPTGNWQPGGPTSWPAGIDNVEIEKRSSIRSDADPRKRSNSNQSFKGASRAKLARNNGKVERTPTIFVPKYKTFLAHPAEDRSDEFFETEFSRLYEKVEEFVKSSYCLFSIIVEKESDSLWGLPFPPQFLSFTKIIAEPDANVGGWNELLANREQRKWLVMGMIARILETKVFSELLFGGDEHQIKLLQTIDTTLVVNEGFSRTELRARAVRTTLGENAVSPFFYESVAALSQQIWDLLAELYMQNDDANKVYLAMTKSTPGNKSPSFLDNLQAINDFVADAAYLSICIRLSPEIMVFQADHPGSPYDSNLHDSIDNLIYKASKAAAAAQQAQRTTSGVGKAAPVYRAMTQIAVWPGIERYKPGNGTKAGAKEGFRIYKICNAQVVCYSGLEARHRKGKVTEDLVEFATARRKMARGRSSKGSWGLALTTASLGIAVTAIALLISHHR